MLYSRLLAPWLLWLVLMLTHSATALCVITHNSTECLSHETNPHMICKGQTDWQRVRSIHCGRTLASSLPSPPPRLNNCIHSISTLIKQDHLAHYWVNSFHNIMDRYDCSQGYSVKFKCDKCKEAYRSWVCSTMISYWVKGHLVKPCRSFCHRVEQKCPFFLPLDKSPAHYAGEPTFLCLDPNIDETGEQLENSAYGSNGCCYDLCLKEHHGSEEFCLRGTCFDDRKESISHPNSEAYSSSAGSQPPSTITRLLTLSSLIYFRTRLLI